MAHGIWRNSLITKRFHWIDLCGPAGWQPVAREGYAPSEGNFLDARQRGNARECLVMERGEIFPPNICDIHGEDVLRPITEGRLRELVRRPNQ